MKIVMNLKITLLMLFLTNFHTTQADLLNRKKKKLENEKTDQMVLPPHSEWVNIPPYLLNVLVSIDDKLRGLETFGQTVRMTKLGYSLEHLSKRLDSIELKIATLQTNFDLRMEKVEKVVLTKGITEEFSNNHLSKRLSQITETLNKNYISFDRKSDTNVDRVINIIRKVESRLQSSHDDIDDVIVKVEEHQQGIRTDNVDQNNLIKQISTEVESVQTILKKDILKKLASKTGKIENNLKSLLELTSKQKEYMNSEIQELKQSTKALHELPIIVNQTLQKVKESLENVQNETGNDGKTFNTRGKQTTIMRNSNYVLMNISNTLEKVSAERKIRLGELNNEINHFMEKIYHGIQDLWNNSDRNKLKLERILKEGNETRDGLKDQFDKLHKEVLPVGYFQPQLKQFQKNLEDKLYQLENSVDKSFETMLVSQNYFVNSCQDMMQMQEHLPTLMLYLNSMIEEMRNKTEIKDLQEYIQDANFEIASALNRLHEIIIDSHNGKKCDDGKAKMESGIEREISTES